MARSGFTKAEVMILLNGNSAKNTLDDLKKRAASLSAELEEMGDAANLDEQGTKRWKEVQKELTVVQSAIKKLEHSMKSTQDVINDLSGSSFNQLKKAARDLRKQINDLTEQDINKFPQLLVDLASVENQIAKIEDKVSDTKRALSGVPEEVENITEKYNDQGNSIETLSGKLGKYLALIGGAGAILSKSFEAFNQNVALSDTLADVRKATGLTADEVTRLSTSLESLDTRTTLEGLNQLAYAGGRMGIQGADNLLGFVKAADQLDVALAEDLGEGAIETLTKMADVMGLIDKMGYEKALLSIGSAINTLTSSSVAAGGPIVDMISRLAGVGVQSNLTTDEILALSATSDAAGLSAETAATSLSQFIVKLKTDTDAVAKAAGISAVSLKDLIEEGRTMDAVIATFEGLSRKGGIEALAPAMKDLGGSGSRAITVISTLVNNVDDLKEMLDVSRNSFTEAISVTDEYNVKNENAAALVQRMKNSVEEFFVNSRMVERIEAVLRSLMKLPALVEENKTQILAALSLITVAMVRTNVTITKFGFLRRLVLLRNGLSSLFSLLMKNPYAVAITGLTMLAAAAYDSYKKVDYLGQAQSRLKELSKDSSAEIEKENIRISQLFDWLKRTEKGSSDYNRAKNAILSNYGKYLEGLGDEIEKLEDVKGAYDAITLAATKAAKARMAERGLTQANEAYATTTGDIYSEIYEEIKKTRSEEEASSIIDRIRKAVDTGEEMPEDIQALIDTKVSKTYRGSTGATFEVSQETALPMLVQRLRKAKSALDVEIEEIGIKYGKIEDILSGNDLTGSETGGGTTTTTVDETPEEKKRKALKAAQDERDAALAALELFYKQQEQVVNDAYINREITSAQREQRLSDIEKRALESRIAARKLILNDEGAAEGWSKELAKMNSENIATSEENSQALDAIYKKNLQDIGDRLRKFGEGEMDGIRKDLEQDRLTIQVNAIKLRQELERILLENDFTGKVTQQYMSNWERLGFAMSQTEGEAEVFMKDMNEKIYPKLFDIDINTSVGLDSFKKLLSEAAGVSAGMLKLNEEQMRVLYYQAIEYGDEMTDAMRRARKEGQRLTDEVWRSSGGLDREKQLDRDERKLNDTTGQLSRIGLSSEAVANDAEIELYRKRVEAAQEYRDLVMQMGGDVLSAEQKLNESIDELSNALVDKTLRHLETLKSFVDPLEDFGTKLGEAFAMDDAIERQEAFRDAIKGLVSDVGDATKEMIVNWVKQKIQHAITKRAMAATEKASQKEMTSAVDAGQKAEQTLVEQGQKAITDAVTDFGNQAVAAKKAQTAESVSDEAAKASAKVPLGIAEGAANTIGELGWWGIPLVAVITALLNGLLSAAMSKVGSLFGGGSSKASAATSTKLVTGMLTYDGGNVQQVLGSDGRIYQARVGGIHGSGIVTSPTLTNVNGQTALVGERGPELVIGRETTRMMMENAPELLASLVQFDKMYSGRGFRTFDRGNLSSLALPSGTSSEEAEQAMMERILTAVNIALTPTLTSVGEAMAANARAQQTLVNRLNKPMSAQINKRQLIDEVADGLLTDKRTGRNKNVTRLFG